MPGRALDPREPAGARAYPNAVAHAQAATPLLPSIANGQIAAALRGEFGNVPVTAGSELFADRLTDVYFAVDVALVIEEHRDGVVRRARRVLPR